MTSNEVSNVHSSISQGCSVFGRASLSLLLPTPHFSTLNAKKYPSRAAGNDMISAHCDRFPLKLSVALKMSLMTPSRQLVPRGSPTDEMSHFAIKRTLNAVGVCADPFHPSLRSPLSGLENTFYRSVLGEFRHKMIQIYFRNPRRSVNIPKRDVHSA